MKVLVAHTFYQQPGGENTVFRQEVDLLRRRGHEVVIYTRSNAEIESYGLIDKLLLFPRTAWNDHAKRDLGAVLDREQPDLVHFHNTFPLMSPSVYEACRERDIKTVQTLHNFRLCCASANFFRDGAPCETCLQHGPWNGVINGCYRNSRLASAAVATMISFNRARGTWTTFVDRFIALSQFAKNKFVEAGIPSEHISVKPNFVSPDPGPRQLTGQHAIYMGRLTEEKGLRTLTASWGMLGSDIPLYIVGDGPLRPELEAGAAGMIQFLGHTPRENALELLKSARFLVFPSEWYECFPMVLVEAFACGVPVVASDIGSIPEIVHDGITGRLFQPGNSNSLLQQLRWAVANPDELEAMGRHARSEFEIRYTAERNYQVLLEIYAQALGRAFEPALLAKPA